MACVAQDRAALAGRQQSDGPPPTQRTREAVDPHANSPPSNQGPRLQRCRRAAAALHNPATSAAPCFSCTLAAGENPTATAAPSARSTLASCPALAGGCWQRPRGCPTPAAQRSSRPCGEEGRRGSGGEERIQRGGEESRGRPLQLQLALLCPGLAAGAGPLSGRSRTPPWHLCTMHSMKHRRSLASPAAVLSATASSSSVFTCRPGRAAGEGERVWGVLCRGPGRAHAPHDGHCSDGCAAAAAAAGASPHPRGEQLAAAVVHGLHQADVVPVLDDVVCSGGVGWGGVEVASLGEAWPMAARLCPCVAWICVRRQGDMQAAPGAGLTGAVVDLDLD